MTTRNRATLFAALIAVALPMATPTMADPFYFHWQVSGDSGQDRDFHRDHDDWYRDHERHEAWERHEHEEHEARERAEALARYRYAPVPAYLASQLSPAPYGTVYVMGQNRILLVSLADYRVLNAIQVVQPYQPF